MKRLLIVPLCFIVFSCAKEELTSGAPSMIGIWIHYSDDQDWEKLVINEDGTGKIEWYANGGLNNETKTKTWYTEDNRLYFGKSTFNIKPYSVNQFPQLSTFTTTEGFDTLTQGVRYCKLNNQYFIEKG